MSSATRFKLTRADILRLPDDCAQARPAHFDVQRIFFAKGSLATPDRRRFVERIVALYPRAEVHERLDTPHNRIDLDESDPLRLHQAGKRTLAFGELKSAVRFSREEGNACPNYWHFSPYGFCPYGCKYCYLGGTPGVKFSPTVKVYVNLPEMLARIDRIARGLGTPTAFYLGKLQDGLALDPLTAYSTRLVPFFAQHPFARMTLLTKSASVDRLLDLDHRGRTILSWSLNPPEIAARFEENVPTVEERLNAMRRCAERGYRVRAVIMPILPVAGWRASYTSFVQRLVEAVPIERLTLGGICIYRGAQGLMQRKLGAHNFISNHISRRKRDEDDGRARYNPELRRRVYSTIIAAARKVRPDLPIALCLETADLWRAVGLAGNMGRCNCVL